ncbi:hypothetical protein CQ018_15520 [Arthrobacter sp. MYb227]|uniref:hypothetical protein n=1 Tax=Arthrobacter sp. MYb227 TaxID=1848601 RepID=UPI000CFD8E03|nr:hypothetical protein [Arthrobacter sp. MYb227]PQZ89561.1 hypothetical protein CQ018_15520 [Arthrobacter sp. MYb227]
MQQAKLSLLALIFGASVLLFSGCADDGVTSGPIPDPTPLDETKIELSISIRANGKVQSAHYTLNCSGSAVAKTSDHPLPSEACELLAKSPQILDPAPSNQMCTEQYGGPATALVTGTRDGKAVNREFDLKNGCGISDWGNALPLLVQQPSGN